MRPVGQTAHLLAFGNMLCLDSFACLLSQALIPVIEAIVLLSMSQSGHWHCNCDA